MYRNEHITKADQPRSKRGAHFTREHQQRARRRVSSESCARNGRLGAQAPIAKYGQQFFFNQWRAWKLEHPSRPELVVIGILSTLDVCSEREWQIGSSFYTCDFYLPDFDKAIEVHGRIHGTLRQQERAENDVKKRDLLQQAGVDCLWLNAEDLRDVAALIGKIQDFINGTEKGAQ